MAALALDSATAIVDTVLTANPYVRTLSAREHEQKPQTREEKSASLLALLQRDPALFLERHGAHLREAQLREIATHCPSYEVDFYVKSNLRRFDNSEAAQRTRAAVVHNRRFAYMQTVLDDTDYFSVDHMRERHPLLHEQTFGVHKPAPFQRDAPLYERLLIEVDEDRTAQRLEQQRTEAAAAAVAAITSTSATTANAQPLQAPSAITNATIALPTEQPRVLTAFRRYQRAFEPGRHGFHEKAGDNDDEDEEDEDYPSDERSASAADADMQDEPVLVVNPETGLFPDPQLWTPAEREHADAYFLRTARERFLAGEDAEWVDYATIDTNASLDDIEQEGRDAQERYFDADDGDDGDGVYASARSR